ncbi:MAG: hypothetical protein BWX70_02924 [Verrucomicrobia bacterium ADurb.Bin070]|nr:MAG: hypothetical protein BWX70_02924 [Verrucomicrobia bacterium ADurb.Bin070]
MVPDIDLGLAQQPRILRLALAAPLLVEAATVAAPEPFDAQRHAAADEARLLDHQRARAAARRRDGRGVAGRPAADHDHIVLRPDRNRVARLRHRLALPCAVGTLGLVQLADGQPRHDAGRRCRGLDPDASGRRQSGRARISHSGRPNALADLRQRHRVHQRARRRAADRRRRAEHVEPFRSRGLEDAQVELGGLRQLRALPRGRAGQRSGQDEIHGMRKGRAGIGVPRFAQRVLGTVDRRPRQGRHGHVLFDHLARLAVGRTARPRHAQRLHTPCLAARAGGLGDRPRRRGVDHHLGDHRLQAGLVGGHHAAQAVLAIDQHTAVARVVKKHDAGLQQQFRRNHRIARRTGFAQERPAELRCGFGPQPKLIEAVFGHHFAAQKRGLVEQHDARALTRGAPGRRHAAFIAADDHDIHAVDHRHRPRRCLHIPLLRPAHRRQHHNSDRNPHASDSHPLTSLRSNSSRHTQFFYWL